MKARVYLDHHATTPLTEAVRAAMHEAIEEAVGNASSPHADGRRMRQRLEAGRRAVGAAMGGAAREVVFTSGGTEAVQLAVYGVGESLGATAVFCDPGAHPCLRTACEGLAAKRGVPLRWVPLVAGAGGMHDLDALAAALAAHGKGALIGVSAVQHETGGIADLDGLGRVASSGLATLVVDAVQALGKVKLAAAESAATAMAVSAHKIGGPAGIGALWLRAGVPIVQRQTGGGQERGVRAGTENAIGVAGFAAAAEGVAARLDAMTGVAALRDTALAVMELLGASRNDAVRARVATVAHASWEGLAAQELVAALDLEGISVSSGAACSSGKAEPSESVLRLHPEAPWRAAGALRVSLGPATTKAEITRFADTLRTVLARF